jgi:hypothetical protein
MALFTTALGLYGGVLWSGELQGFIIHEMVPTASCAAIQAKKRKYWLVLKEIMRAAPLFFKCVRWHNT